MKIPASIFAALVLSTTAAVAPAKASTVSYLVSFTDVGTYGVGGAPWNGTATVSASFTITFDPTLVYAPEPLTGIISNLTYSVTDNRFANITLNNINSCEYAYGTLTLYSDSALKKALDGTPNITLGINGWTNPFPASAAWYSQALFEDTLTTSGDVFISPIPAALPLFASGLGALGFMGWRKRRKSATVATA